MSDETVRNLTEILLYLILVALLGLAALEAYARWRWGEDVWVAHKKEVEKTYPMFLMPWKWPGWVWKKLNGHA